MKNQKLRAILYAVSITFLFSLASFVTRNNRREKEKWVSLFNGKDLKGWHSYNQDKVVGWIVENGLLSPDGSGGDLTTDKEYGDFDLEFEFKIPERSNSGVVYKVLEKPEIKRSVFSGPEYQIIDDTGYVVRNAQGEVVGLMETQKTGANYGMNPPLDKTAFKVAGTWNTGRIVVQKEHVRHFLNGKLVADYQYGSADWQEKLKESKFKDWPYAMPHHKGKIALQNHNAEEKIWFRDIRIKELSI